MRDRGQGSSAALETIGGPASFIHLCPSFQKVELPSGLASVGFISVKAPSGLSFNKIVTFKKYLVQGALPCILSPGHCIPSTKGSEPGAGIQRGADRPRVHTTWGVSARAPSTFCVQERQHEAVGEGPAKKAPSRNRIFILNKIKRTAEPCSSVIKLHP